MARLLDLYKNDIAKAMAAKFNHDNPMSIPKLTKIVINMGVGKATQDKAQLESAVDSLSKISGQKPVVTKAKVSVSGFRLREGNDIGCKVTLRGRRMYEFLDRLISIALPRIRDFRGVNPNSFDGHGNYSLGLAEQVVFPEIDADKMQHTHGMDITIVTTAANDDQARELLHQFGLPFRQPAAKGSERQRCVSEASSSRRVDDSSQLRANCRDGRRDFDRSVLLQGSSERSLCRPRPRRSSRRRRASLRFSIETAAACAGVLVASTASSASAGSASGTWPSAA